MRYLRIKNWAEFQHYKDRNPPWIKLHRALLDDYDFAALPDATKAHLVLMWLFASQNDGKIPEDAKFLHRKLGLEKPPDLDALITQGFLIQEQNASETLSERKHDASNTLALARSRESEKRREEEIVARFAAFWAHYPRKVAKQDAMKAWRKVDAHHAAIMAGLRRAVDSEQWRKDGGQFIPHPATFLNKRRWEDDWGTVTTLQLRRADPLAGVV